MVAAWIFVINAYFLEGIAIYAFQKKGLTKSMFTLLKQPSQSGKIFPEIENTIAKNHYLCPDGSPIRSGYCRAKNVKHL
jgi:hypothetical protein